MCFQPPALITLSFEPPVSRFLSRGKAVRTGCPLGIGNHLGQRQTLRVRVKKSSVLSQGTGKLSHLRRRLESEDMILDGRESGKEALMMRHSS
jgi:hypothetical protein